MKMLACNGICLVLVSLCLQLPIHGLFLPRLSQRLFKCEILDAKKSTTRLAVRSDVDYDGAQDWEEGMEGYEGVDWHLEQARRMLEGPGFAPLRMTLWQPPSPKDPKEKKTPPGFFDSSKILINNAFQMMGLAKSIDGAPLVQGVNTFKGSPMQLISRVLDGNLQELAGGPLFLLLHDYYKLYGPVYKLAFGPKSFIVVSDPVMVKHILKVLTLYLILSIAS